MKKIEESIRYDIKENIKIYTLLNHFCETIEFIPKKLTHTELKVGDIIHANRYYSSSSNSYISGHYVYIIDIKRLPDNSSAYSGYAISSQSQKSNKHNSHYPNNIDIADDNTIYAKRTGSSHVNVLIRVDDIVTFTDADLSASGVWKGYATYEFNKFIEKAVHNYKSGKSNADMFWEGVSIT